MTKRSVDGPSGWSGGQSRTPRIKSKKLTTDYYAEVAKEAEVRRLKRLKNEGRHKKTLAAIEAMRKRPPPGDDE